ITNYQRYHKVEAFLGEGPFGVVTKCQKTKNKKAVAIKINKSKPEILQQAKLEIFILEKLRRLDGDTCNIVKWNGYFLDGKRICLNFELLDQNLWDYMKDRNHQGLPIRELRPILQQLANALFHLSSLGIVHADLKLGNIVVVNRHQSPVKVIDFGLACPVRAPEVMLHIPYNEAIEMWSLGLVARCIIDCVVIGCVILRSLQRLCVHFRVLWHSHSHPGSMGEVAVELATGVPLYPGNEDYHVLKFIIHTQGQPPDYILDCGMATEYYIRKDDYSEQRWTFKMDEQFQYETGDQSKETPQHLDDGTNLLVSLIKEMLALDPNRRINPSEVLQHLFFDIWPIHHLSLFILL
uniref:Protein kinase domain-containing protein n=1 Tax=Haplochromis burtoni TaxID=8153 RepID=A0A3Q3C3A8_HAPBU